MPAIRTRRDQDHLYPSRVVSYATYIRGCRCDGCVAANNRYKHEHSKRSPEERQRIKDNRRARLDANRACKRCGVQINETNRSKNGVDAATGRTQYRNTCKKCYASRMRQYLQSHPEIRSEQVRKARIWATNNPRKRADRLLRLRFSIGIDEYERIAEAQGHKCAVCGRDERDIDKRSGKRRRLAVDHCHKTGEVRGLLCGFCNRALGMLDEDIAMLQRAIMYLQKHRNRVYDAR